MGVAGHGIADDTLSDDSVVDKVSFGGVIKVGDREHVQITITIIEELIAQHSVIDVTSTGKLTLDDQGKVDLLSNSTLMIEQEARHSDYLTPTEGIE